MSERGRLTSDVGPWGALPAWLYACCGHTAIALFGLLAARYADTDGVAFPSRNRMAADLRCSTSTVDRAVAELIAAGGLEKLPRLDEDGAQTSNLYRLRYTRPVGVWNDGQEEPAPRSSGPTGDDGGHHGSSPPLITGAAPPSSPVQPDPDPSEPDPVNQKERERAGRAADAAAPTPTAQAEAAGKDSTVESEESPEEPRALQPGLGSAEPDGLLEALVAEFGAQDGGAQAGGARHVAEGLALLRACGRPRRRGQQHGPGLSDDEVREMLTAVAAEMGVERRMVWEAMVAAANGDAAHKWSNPRLGIRNAAKLKVNDWKQRRGGRHAAATSANDPRRIRTGRGWTPPA